MIAAPQAAFWRCLLLLVLVCVTLDFTNPFLPGAFVFNADDCVDGVCCQHQEARERLSPRRAERQDPDVARDLLERSHPRPARSRPFVSVRTPAVRRAPLVQADAAPSPDDPGHTVGAGWRGPLAPDRSFPSPPQSYPPSNRSYRAALLLAVPRARETAR